MGYTPSHRLAGELDDDDDRDLGRYRATEALEWGFISKPDERGRVRSPQWDFFAHVGDPKLSVEGYFGGWGCGKTSGAARKHYALACVNGWDSRYQNAKPTSAIIAPTMRILAQATIEAFDRILPRSSVFKRHGSPKNYIDLTNGHRILLVSAASELEGVNLTHLWCDEIHHPAYDHYRFLNFQARVRDPFRKRGVVMATGIPESTWIRDVFDVDPSPTRFTVLSATADNPNIDPLLLAEFYASCPSGEEQKLFGGQWMPPIGAFYPQFDPTVHVVDREGDPRVPVHLSMDVGNQAAVLVWQEIDVLVHPMIGRPTRETGMLCVDQLLPEDASVEAIAQQLMIETPWQLRDGYSRIMVDPKTDRDERHSLRRWFPKCQIVQRDRSDERYFVDTGIRLTQRAFRDALGNARVFFSRKLERGRPGERIDRGVLASIPRYKRNDKTGLPVKDNKHDHMNDALRYAVCELLPVVTSGARTLR